MVGYPESLTDPSYSSQILILTYPLIGNYGVPERPALTPGVPPPTHLLDELPLEFESNKIHISALVVANYHPTFSHHLAKSSLGQWLKEQGIPAIWGVDTRMLTKKIREGGVLLGRVLGKKPETQRGRETSVLGGVGKLLSGLSASPMGRSASTDRGSIAWREEYETIPFSDPNTGNLVAKVSTLEPTLYSPITGSDIKTHPKTGKTIRVLAVDVGMKWNQIRCFRNRGVEVKVVPWVCP
jgi:carbamoyl-phosphate synthase/aspartate carbamoyltransferase